MARTMQEEWDDAAQQWIRWARTPGHDHYYWRFARPALLELLPKPGGLTLDIGCGEGRLARELMELGHRVIGIEASTALADAARAAGPPTEVLVTDARSVPLSDGEADLAITCMSLLNFDDLDEVLCEIARLLTPGGRFCFATVHPARSIDSARAILGGGSYFNELRFVEVREREGLEMDFHDIHRPLSALLAGIERAGLLIEALREPIPDTAYIADVPEVERWLSEPCFLHGRAVKLPSGFAVS